MEKRFFQNATRLRKIALILTAIVILLTVKQKSWSQNSVQTVDSSTASAVSTAKSTVSLPAETPVSAADSSKTALKPEPIKVTFDEITPGVMIVESNGQKFRVDSTKKTVELISATPSETVAEKVEPKAAEKVAAAPQAKAQDDAQESEFDFDKGEEPYDYRLINVPTPKSVPKGTWNLWFSHRFSQPIHPLSESGKALLGFDSFSASSFGITYGITDKLSLTAYRQPICQRGLCRTIEIGFGYQLLNQDKKSPIALRAYASVEGNENFSQEYTYNLQALASARLGKRVYLFFSPAIHLNSNGQRRFNPRPEEFFPPAQIANTYKVPTNGASYGFGTSVLITPTILGLFEFTPRTGFKLGAINPTFDSNFNVTGFTNTSYPEIGFGIQKNIGKHSFTITFTNTQTTTTSRYNSSNLVLSPKRLIVGFNLFRRW
jgi:Membrane bound beta barrel domain (DUF5777)